MVVVDATGVLKSEPLEIESSFDRLRCALRIYLVLVICANSEIGSILYSKAQALRLCRL